MISFTFMLSQLVLSVLRFGRPDILKDKQYQSFRRPFHIWFAVSVFCCFLSLLLLLLLPHRLFCYLFDRWWSPFRFSVLPFPFPSGSTKSVKEFSFGQTELIIWTQCVFFWRRWRNPSHVLAVDFFTALVFDGFIFWSLTQWIGCLLLTLCWHNQRFQIYIWVLNHIKLRFIRQRQSLRGCWHPEGGPWTWLPINPNDRRSCL